MDFIFGEVKDIFGEVKDNDIDVLDIISEGKYNLQGAEEIGRGSYGVVMGLSENNKAVISENNSINEVNLAVKLVLFDDNEQTIFENEAKYYKMASSAQIGPPIIDLFFSHVALKGLHKSVGAILMKRCRPFTIEDVTSYNLTQVDLNIQRMANIGLHCYDLKPQNLLMDDISVYITDYGTFCNIHHLPFEAQRHHFLMKITFYIICGNSYLNNQRVVDHIDGNTYIDARGLQMYPKIVKMIHHYCRYNRQDWSKTETENRILNVIKRIAELNVQNVFDIPRNYIIDIFYQGAPIVEATHVMSTSSRMELRY